MTYCIDISEENGIRYLHFGSEWVQGAMRIRRPNHLELAYTREMLTGLLLHDTPSWPKRILLIGLGAASLTKFCYWKLPQSRIQVVEIEADVVAAARQFFKLPEPDARLNIRIADGVEFIQGQRPTYDYILVDGYDENAQVGELDSLSFYLACHARLSEHGLISVNLFGRDKRYGRYGASLKRLADAFGGRMLAFPSAESGNIVALAARGKSLAVDLKTLKTRAIALRRNTGLDLRPMIQQLSDAGHLPEGLLRL